MKILLLILIFIAYMMFSVVIAADMHKYGEEQGYHKGFEDGRRFEARRHEDDPK